MPNTIPAAGEAMPKYQLSIAIHRYRSEVNAHMANCLEIESRGGDGADLPKTYASAMRVLETWDRPAEDRDAAVMALELAVEDYEMGDTPRIPAMMKAALGYLEKSRSNAPAPKIAVARFSTDDLCRVYRAIDTIEEVANMADQHLLHVIGKETPASDYLAELQEYLGAERGDVVDALRSRPNTADNDGRSRLATIIQFEAWSQEFNAETLEQLSGSCLATDAVRSRR